MLRKLLSFTLVLFALSNSKVNAQSPGGIPVTSWYRADAAGTLFSDAGITTATNNATVYQWNEYTGAGFNLLQASAGSRPVFSNASVLANFNPTLTFDGSNDWMQFTAGTGVNVIDRASGTLYAAGYMNQRKPSGFLGFHASMDYPGLHFFSDYKLLFFTGGPGYQGVSADAMQAQTYFTSGTGWLNGAGSTASYAAATVSLNGNRVDYTGTQLNNANLSTGARDLRIGADNNYGSFSGQLNEIMVYEDRLTSGQMDQVETYLAIKYGTTYANGSRDYKNSAGGIVWNAVTNNGYHYNIAGIARDDQGALLQKQSWSTSPGQQVLIGVGGLANTNAANGGTLTDNQYLVWGDNGLVKAPTVTISGITGLSHRFASVWKVQQTGVGTVRVAWAKGLSNLTLIQSTDALFDGSDVATAMTGEITVNGVVYNYADVTLADGQYFTIGAKLAGPGGVTDNLRVWLKSNEGFTPSSWTDFSGFNNHYTQTNISRQPFTASAMYNFNPVIDFGTSASASGRFMVVPDGKPFSANGLSGTFFTATMTRTGGTSGYRDIWGFGATTTGAGLINADVPTITKLYDNIVLYSSTTSAFPNQYPDNKFLLSDMSYTVGVAGIKYGLNGATAATTQTRTAGSSLQANGSVLGSQPQVTNGVIGEAIAFERDLTEAEKQRVRTYTAIKYGITLPHNYIASDGSTIVWDQTANSGYNNNIAGLTNDEGSALHQKQSNSINDGQQVLISTTGLANSNAANMTSLASGQFVLWGDNGLPKVPATAISGVPGVNFRFGAVWKVQNTGNAGTVRVAWPTGLVNLTLLQGTDPGFATVSNSQNMSANIITVNGVAYNYADVTLADGEYFTFASQLNGPAGVGLDLRVWLRSDAGFAPASWTDFSGNSNDYTQTNSSRQPFTAAIQYNFNPAIDFGTTGADARFMVVPSGKPYSANGTSSTIFTASVSKSASGYTDIIGFGGTTTGTGLANANLPTFTKQNNNLVLYPYITAPALPATELNRLYLDDVSYTVGVSGIKYGQNGQTASTAQTFAAGNALYANGSILGAQPEVRNGLIGEVIAYQRDLTEAEKERIRSYVAIKYGITLPHNYVASNGSTIFWNIGANTGYNNNIAGIARDDYGSLGQKQSKSINTGSQVLISTTGLAESNAANGQLLSDQQFLAWGDNGLPKSPTVAIAGVPGVNYHFASTWKVQNTGNVGTVRVAWRTGYSNLKLIQSTDATFTSSDIITDMASSQTVNGVEYSYADVTIADGQYFTFAAFLQAPGGVTNNLSYWYRADKFAEATAVGAEVTSWTDFTAGTVSAQLGDNALPVSAQGSSTYFNYNPGIKFTATAQTLGNLNVQTVSSLNYDLFTLTKEGVSPGGNGRIFSSLVNNTNQSGSVNYWDGIGIMADQRIERMNTMFTNRYLANPGSVLYSTNSPSIMYNKFTDVDVAKGLNGAVTGTAGTHSARGLFNGGHAFGSTQFSSNGSDNAGFTGDLGELIIYGNGNVTNAERNKIESYLAIKYGITLQNSNNYTTSQDVVVWDAVTNSSFYNHVAGVGYDFNSALLQKQSRSQQANTNGQVIIGLGDIAEDNFANTSTLSDGQFLLWGDNGNTTAMTNIAGTYTALSYGGTSDSRRMNRIWKVQNTGVSNEVKIRFPVASVGTTTLTANDACAAYAIIYADDAAFTTNVAVVPLTINGTDYEATHTFANGASYFTFGKATPISAGAVYLPDVMETTTQTVDNCGIGTAWSYFRKSDDPTLKLLATADVSTAPLTVTITPEGTTYDDGTTVTKLMPRVATVTDATSGTYASVKVRVYYHPDELSATQVSGASTNSWFKYSGDAETVVTDIYSDGRFDPSTAIALTPDATGEEDGVNYVEFHNITSFSSFVYVSSTQTINAVLPVSITDFTAKAQDNNVLLNWTTASESNNKGFDVERSADAMNWSSLGFVGSKAINGNSAGTITYNYTDRSPLNSRSYYRLKQTDIDGNFKYSLVRTVHLNSTRAVTLLPNPVQSILLIQGLVGRNTVSIFDLNGKLVKVVQTKQDVMVQIDVSQLPGGIYLVKTEDAAGNRKSFKVIKR